MYIYPQHVYGVGMKYPTDNILARVIKDQGHFLNKTGTFTTFDTRLFSI